MLLFVISSVANAYTTNWGQEAEKYARQLNAALNGKLKDEDIRRNQKARLRFANR